MSKLKQLVSRLHHDQRGSTSLENIVVFALGVLVLGGVWYVWQELDLGGDGKEKGVKGGITQYITKLFGWDFTVNSN